MAPDRVGRLNDRLQSQDAVVPAQSIEEKSGIALLNVSRRLKMRFGDDYGLYIYSTRGVGTDVEIRLPLVRET